MAAVARLWPDLPPAQSITIPAGQADCVIIDKLPANGVVQINAKLGQGATLAVFALLHGVDYGRVEVRVELAASAHLELGGVILESAAQTLEIVTEAVHAAPDATSNQIVRSVLGGTATGSYLGKVHVARDAQRTDASQSVKSMLLSRGATANAKPELEIYADDVKCAHGATVGELDAMSLFYMAARGIAPADARRLMLQAFIADAFAHAGDARDGLAAAAQGVLDTLL
ncbi:MAG: SufD family Fe-S cluster assembly protein [Sphingopyxis sp.]